MEACAEIHIYSELVNERRFANLFLYTMLKYCSQLKILLSFTLIR
jgi:hypothetical protein